MFSRCKRTLNILETFTGRSIGSETERKLSTSFRSPVCGRSTVSKVQNTDVSSLKTDILELEEKNKRLNEELNELRNMDLKEEELPLYIDRLHKYNEIKDVAQMLLGKIALEEQCTTKQLYEEYGLSLDD